MFKQQPPSPPPSTAKDSKYNVNHWNHQINHSPGLPQEYKQEYQPEFHLDYQPTYQQPYQSAQQEKPYTHADLGGIPSLQVHNMGSAVPGIALGEYGDASLYQNASRSEYPPIMPVPQPTFFQASQLSTPPETAGEGGIRTRSGRSIPAPGPSSVSKNLDVDRVTKRARSPRPKRVSRQAKADKSQGPIITAPLSELTKHLKHIPIKDMEAWVNRSTEVRQKEVEKKNGKIARPMNSFMLYRSAYAERTKEWCAQNNHQVVSRASGQSWPLESKEVRDQFERYAATERDNHQKAHPGYKFAPNKNQAQPKRKRPLDEEDGPSDLDDVDFDLDSSPRNIHKRARGSETEDGYNSRNSTPFDPRSMDLYSHTNRFSTSMSRTPSWQAANPGRPLPEMVSPPEQTLYYHPSPQPSMIGHSVDNMGFQSTESPNFHYDRSGLITGVPGGASHDLLQPSSHASTPGPMDGIQVDPELLAYDQGMPMAGGGDVYTNTLGDWQQSLGQNGHYPRSPLIMDQHLPQQQPFHPGMQTLTDGRDPWKLHSDEMQLDAGAEFDELFSTTGY